MSDAKMRVATSIPSLKGKIRTELTGPTDIIYWYIRFNIPLDENTVNDQTMTVTDTDGYIMRTDIAYQTQHNRICISPLDTYEENRYYLLAISKQVCSARGQPLKTKIHILFKLYRAQVSEYKVMRSDVKVPKPKPRPSDYEARQASRTLNAIDLAYGETVPQDRLAMLSVKANLWTGVVGLFMVLGGVAAAAAWLMVMGACVCIAGVGHIYSQLRDRDIASRITYNRGVRLFHRERYLAAQEAFAKAVKQNPNNEFAKYGLYKTGLINKERNA